jgi:hypothetical protein
MTHDPAVARRLVLSIRVAEGAAAVLALSAAVELWTGLKEREGFPGGFGEQGTASGLSLADRFTQLVAFSFRGPIYLVLAALVLAPCLYAVRFVTSEAHAKVLLWEQVALAAAGALLALVHVVAGVVVVVAGEPEFFGPEAVPQVISGLGFPVAALLLCGLFGYWWWHVRAEMEAKAAESFAAAMAAAEPVPGDESPAAPAAARRDRKRRDKPERLTVRAVMDLDGSDFADAEIIEAAPPPERAPLSGYDNYFKRR